MTYRLVLILWSEMFATAVFQAPAVFGGLLTSSRDNVLGLDGLGTEPT